MMMLLHLIMVSGLLSLPLVIAHQLLVPALLQQLRRAQALYVKLSIILRALRLFWAHESYHIMIVVLLCSIVICLSLGVRPSFPIFHFNSYRKQTIIKN